MSVRVHLCYYALKVIDRSVRVLCIVITAPIMIPAVSLAIIGYSAEWLCEVVNNATVRCRDALLEAALRKAEKLCPEPPPQEAES